MNSSPRPYLKVARLQSTQRGIRSTSSCSTLTHSTGPMPSGKSKTSGSLNGGVVNQPRSFSQITGGLRHSSIVVQIENDGAKLVAVVVGHHEVRAVAGAELVDLGEQVVGGVAGEHVGEPGLHADADQREPAGAPPTRRPWRTARRRASRRTRSYGVSGCGFDRLIAMSR